MSAGLSFDMSYKQYSYKPVHLYNRVHDLYVHVHAFTYWYMDIVHVVHRYHGVMAFQSLLTTNYKYTYIL